MAGKTPDPLDVLVGRNIKSQRVTLGLAQAELAGRVGLTTQQLQKLESGVQRAGGEVLFRLAAALGGSLDSFFAGARHSGARSLRASPIALLAEPFALRMLRAYCEIDDMELRRSLVDLAERFAARLQPASAAPPAQLARPRAASRS
jgi:transcriptional regulator with XRE-family HTH domain